MRQEAGSRSVSPPFFIMQFIVEKLDGRHTGNDIWRYRLYITQRQLSVYSHDRFRDFHQFRIWMTEQYGPSCERDYYMDTLLAHRGYDPFEPLWCWHIDREKNHLYIYIRNDDVLSNIHLNWN